MLFMVEKGIRGGICRVIHLYAKDNKKYRKYHNRNKEPAYIKYWDDVNNIYEWAMS